jgi:hypothetical protein
MDTDSHTRQLLAAVSLMESADASPPFSARNAAEIAHSESNILQWMAYLPEDCIKSMIAMGWDFTT